MRSSTHVPWWKGWQVVHATERLRARPWLGEGAAVAASSLALGLRFALDDVLPPGFPYLTFFPAVILTTFFFGLRPGITCAALSGLAAWYFFIPPASTFIIDGPTALALCFYVFIVAVDIALIHVMHRAGERLRAERQISAGLYEQQRTMFQELQHRVANNMQFVAALLTLQKRKVGNDPKAALTALDEARVRLETISRIHRRLYDPSSIERPVGQYLKELCTDLLDATGAQNIVCLVDTPPLRFDLTQLTTLSLLVVEVVTNALKHAFPDGRRGTITIQLERLDAERLQLTIADDGRGMPADFDPDTTRSLGFRIAQGLAGQLGGQLAYSNAGGTVVRLVFIP
ncbi:ATPase [Methylobacterium sp. Leaf104]|uniref:sensor histidine kinase n=1 Tax=Methylobacterium TaxID=407 RepID=UPI0007021ECA|nr:MULTISPECIES: histidine kinase dimerization/phosphoacceptor domain -containing protein [Methylobacterium]KQP42421.1 ATPase [Methylobacterium sp. Leaf104]